MTKFFLNLVLEDIRGRKLPQTIEMADYNAGSPAADYGAAVVDADQLVAAYRAISDARITSKLTAVHDDGGATVRGGDSTESAMLNLHLDAVGDKMTQFYVKVPSQAIFSANQGSNYDLVDTANADLVAFVTELSQHGFVSDGEQVDLTLGNGIDSGKRVTKKYSPKSS